jgi:hypothetical protein
MNFVTRKKLPRRTFLRAAGAGIALPFLDAMVPAFGAPKSERTRLVCIEEVHGLPGCNKWGATQYLFAPATTGRDYELVPLNPLKSLEPWRSRFTIVSNTDVRMAEAFEPPKSDHSRPSFDAHPSLKTRPDSLGTSITSSTRGRSRPRFLPQLCIESTNKRRLRLQLFVLVHRLHQLGVPRASPDDFSPRAAFDMLFERAAPRSGRGGDGPMAAFSTGWLGRRRA